MRFSQIVLFCVFFFILFVLQCNVLHIPDFVPHQFTLDQLAPHRGNGVSVAFIDTGLCRSMPKIQYVDLVKKPITKKYPCFSHGQELVDLLLGDGNKISGLAPQAKVIMIRAFGSNGQAEFAQFNEALAQARSSVLCLSLKLGDELDEKSTYCIQLKKNIQSDWVIAAAGNDGNPDSIDYVGKKLAYPARLSGVDIAVGACDQNYAVAPFSQCELGRGPHVLTQGCAIACRNYASQQKACAYLLRDGTSYACAIATSYVALILGEFKGDFSKEEILKVIRQTCYREKAVMSKCLWGIFDVRYALLVLHILKSLKSLCNVSLYFDQLLRVIIWLFNHVSLNVCYNSLDSFIFLCVSELNSLLFCPLKKNCFLLIPSNRCGDIYRVFQAHVPG